MALTQKYRFPKNAPLFSVAERNQKKFNPLFVLIYRKNPFFKTRAAVVVNKKVDKRATVRNKVKRQVQQTLKIILDSSPLLPYDILIKPQRNIIGKEQKEITNELTKLLRSLGNLSYVNQNCSKTNQDLPKKQLL